MHVPIACGVLTKTLSLMLGSVLNAGWPVYSSNITTPNAYTSVRVVNFLFRRNSGAIYAIVPITTLLRVDMALRELGLEVNSRARPKSESLGMRWASNRMLALQGMTCVNMRDGHVTCVNMRDGHVTCVNMRDGHVTCVNMRDGHVTCVNMRDGHVTCVNMRDGHVTCVNMCKPFDVAMY